MLYITVAVRVFLACFCIVILAFFLLLFCFFKWTLEAEDP